jgi:hypothetical protein
LYHDSQISGVKVRVITDDETCTNLGSDIKAMRDAGMFSPEKNLCFHF